MAVDDDGNPWVAYTVSAQGQQVRVATKSGDEWTTADGRHGPAVHRVRTAPPDAGRGDIGAGRPWRGSTPTRARSWCLSLTATRWTETEVARGVSGQGLDMAVDADGNALLTFFDGQGGVQLARPDGAGWSVTDDR